MSTGTPTAGREGGPPPPPVSVESVVKAGNPTLSGPPAPPHRPVRSDMLSRILSDMCDPSYTAVTGQQGSEDTTLKEFVDTTSRGYKGERLKRFIQDIFERARGLIQSSDGCRRMGGVLAVDELGETKVFGDSMSRLSDLIRSCWCMMRC